MTRYKKMLLNSTSSLLYQIVALICGFVLPRLILSKFGSEVNGLVSSITQSLGLISLCEMGVGAVVQSSLYKPLANKNTEEVSKIAISSERFFKKVAFILVLYTAVLMIAYPFVVRDQFDYFYTFFLILVISVSSFAQYYFGMTYRLILSADQFGFINFGIRIVTLILNTVMCVILINWDASIHTVKLTTSVLFLLQPLIISFVAKRKYKINRKLSFTEESIKQKWNGLAQHVASVVHGNVPTIVLTLFSTLNNVSVYAVYHLITNGVKTFMTALTDGMHSMIGNMLAKGETKVLSDTFDIFEWTMHTVVTIVFSLMGALIIPFVSVYTHGLTDANYIVPAVGYLLVAAEATHCLRLPYNILILSAGHYKQTQTSSFIEAFISIAVSVMLVFKFGLIGVAIGLFAAMVYRTIYLIWYLSGNIVYRKKRIFVKHLAVDLLGLAALIVTLIAFPQFFTLNAPTYFDWFILALKMGVVCLVETVAINCLFYWGMVKVFVKTIARKVSKK